MVKLAGLHKKNQHIEPIWHVQLAVLATIVLQLVLDSHLTVGPKPIIIGAELLLFFALALINPNLSKGAIKIRHTAAILLIALVSIANFSSLVLVLYNLFGHIEDVQGVDLLLSALSIYITNIIIFGLWYWELDSDGINGQSVDIEPIDFLFPQMTMGGRAAKNWSPTFFDYLYLSITNGTAFSTTDTAPLTHRAKTLMTVQSFISIAVVVLVVSRAISILG